MRRKPAFVVREGSSIVRAYAFKGGKKMSIEAVLDTFEISLQDVINWKVGSRVMLNADAHSDVGLVCGDLSMFTGKMGRKGGNIAVRIGEKVERIRGIP